MSEGKMKLAFNHSLIQKWAAVFDAWSLDHLLAVQRNEPHN